MKKILAVLLSAVIGLSCFAIAASAEENEETYGAAQEIITQYAGEQDEDGGYLANLARASILLPAGLLSIVIAPFLLVTFPPLGLAALAAPGMLLQNFFNAVLTGKSYL